MHLLSRKMFSRAHTLIEMALEEYIVVLLGLIVSIAGIDS